MNQAEETTLLEQLEQWNDADELGMTQKRR